MEYAYTRTGISSRGNDTPESQMRLLCKYCRRKYIIKQRDAQPEEQVSKSYTCCSCCCCIGSTGETESSERVSRGVLWTVLDSRFPVDKRRLLLRRSVPVLWIVRLEAKIYSWQGRRVGWSYIFGKISIYTS